MKSQWSVNTLWPSWYVDESVWHTCTRYGQSIIWYDSYLRTITSIACFLCTTLWIWPQISTSLTLVRVPLEDCSRVASHRQRYFTISAKLSPLYETSIRRRQYQWSMIYYLWVPLGYPSGGVYLSCHVGVLVESNVSESWTDGYGMNGMDR